MADERIATIVKEIKYWKQHQLLPEVYCDFLLALYTNGDVEKGVMTKRTNWNISIVIQLVLLLLLIPFSFLVIYFTQFHTILQLCILLLFIIYASWVFIRLKRSSDPLLHIPLVVLLVLLLFTTIYLSELFSFNDKLKLSIVVGNFFVWLFISFKSRIKYLLLISIIGLIGAILFNIL